MSFDLKMVALALRLINKRGQTITYTKITSGAYDPATGTASGGQTSFVIKALADDFNRASDGLAFLGGLVLEGDKRIRFAAAALTFAPLPGDRVAFDGFVMSVQSVKSVSAGELTALYDLRVRT